MSVQNGQAKAAVARLTIMLPVLSDSAPSVAQVSIPSSKCSTKPCGFFMGLVNTIAMSDYGLDVKNICLAMNDPAHMNPAPLAAQKAKRSRAVKTDAWDKAYAMDTKMNTESPPLLEKSKDSKVMPVWFHLLVNTLDRALPDSRSKCHPPSMSEHEEHAVAKSLEDIATLCPEHFSVTVVDASPRLLHRIFPTNHIEWSLCNGLGNYGLIRNRVLDAARSWHERFGDKPPHCKHDGLAALASI